jgi:hypothetical protein
LEKLLGEAEEEIKLQNQNGVFDVTSLTTAVQNRLASKGLIKIFYNFFFHIFVLITTNNYIN